MVQTLTRLNAIGFQENRRGPTCATSVNTTDIYVSCVLADAEKLHGFSLLFDDWAVSLSFLWEHLVRSGKRDSHLNTLIMSCFFLLIETVIIAKMML